MPVSSLRSALFGLLLVSSLSGAAAAQQPDDPAPPERTIVIGAPDHVDAAVDRPIGDLVEADAGPTSGSLIPLRVSFVDRLIASADQL